MHLSNTGSGVAVLQHQDDDDEHWDLEGANTAYGQALLKSVPDLDWDQLTYITATAEAKDRLKQDSENYRQQKEEQREQERKEKERLRQQELEEPPINLAGLEALKRGFGLRGGHASHLLAPSASRTTAAVQGAANARMAADSVVAATLLVEEKDLEAVTGEILARVRAQDAAEAELLPAPAVEEDAEKPPEQEEVKYKYHYGHSVGMKVGDMDEPSQYQMDPELVAQEAAAARRARSSSRRRLPRGRSGSRGRGLVSLYVEEEEEKEEEVDKVATKSRCPWGHGLERWTCRAEGVKCEDCGPFPLPKHSVFFGCRNCDWHLCSLHGSAAEPEAKPKAEKKPSAEPAQADASEPPPPREPAAEPPGDAAPGAAGGEAAAAGEGEAGAADLEEEEEQRRRARRAPKPEPERGRSEKKLSYKERMKQRLEGAAKRLEEGKDTRRYEWAETGEVASARDAQGILEQARQEREAEMEALRPPSPRLELPEDFCPLCHQIATGAKKPLTKGGHTFKAGCRRAKGA